jgi:mycothione reductase
VKVVADGVTGRMLGAHASGPQASMLIQPLIQAMTFDLPAPTWRAASSGSTRR